MELSPRLQEFITEVATEQDKINDYLVNLKSDGILDESLETYLKKSIKDLQLRKEKLILDLTQNAHYPKTDNSEVSQNKLIQNNLKIMKKPSQEPVSYTKYSQIEKHCPELQKVKLFSKKTSPERGNSPSARRYSPVSNQINEKSPKLGPKGFKGSPGCSTRSSRSSEDKIAGEICDKFENELRIKYEEQRKIRNRAHEKMLLLKEQLLNGKEIEIKEHSGKGNRRAKEIRIDIESVGSRERDVERPPRSPKNRLREVDKSRKMVLGI